MGERREIVQSLKISERANKYSPIGHCVPRGDLDRIGVSSLSLLAAERNLPSRLTYTSGVIKITALYALMSQCPRFHPRLSSRPSYPRERARARALIFAEYFLASAGYADAERIFTARVLLRRDGVGAALSGW